MNGRRLRLAQVGAWSLEMMADSMISEDAVQDLKAFIADTCSIHSSIILWKCTLNCLSLNLTERSAIKMHIKVDQSAL